MDTCYYCHDLIKHQWSLFFTRQYDTDMYTAHVGCRAKHLRMSYLEFCLRCVFTDDISLHHDVFNWRDSFYPIPKTFSKERSESVTLLVREFDYDVYNANSLYHCLNYDKVVAEFNSLTLEELMR